ncbi:unnamed protein product [Paramecium primaurelia]|uniref:Uncharacterized protein n=2 Tax=Paramecium TaxID=5884 RepID=A0A8S1TSK0_9CILI|nr:unnamed protein product [Paramecium primaurelia]CAD8153916.1 unnamed protein product [Paramecium pentaurelia]
MQQRKFIKDYKQFDGFDKIGINFLPCTINKGGECPSEQYFKPQDDKVVIHGRELTKHIIIPPKPLYIFQQQQDGTRVIKGEFKEINKWIFYGTTQHAEQIFQFPNLMEVLHKPIK